MSEKQLVIHYDGHEFIYSNYRWPEIGDYVLSKRGYVLKWNNNTTQVNKIILIRTN